MATKKKPTGYERADYGNIDKEDLATLTVKLPAKLRQHWQVEAKKKNKSLSLIIIELLSKELGTPADS